MKSNLFFRNVFTAIVVCTFACSNVTAQWNQFRGPMRDGFSSETNLLKQWPADGPKLVWFSDTVGEGFSSAVIKDKIVYTTGKRDTLEVLTALDSNGKLIWQTALGKAFLNEWPESRSTPTLYKGNLYTVTLLGNLCCVDSKTGKLVWNLDIRKSFGGGENENFCESPLIEDDKIIITPGGKITTMVALNTSNGETIWKTESIADSNNYVSPVLIRNGDHKIVFTNVLHYYLAVDFNTGKIIWKDTLPTKNFVPLPNEQKVYVTGFQGGRMLSLDEKTINTLWTDTIGANILGGAVKFGNRIYSSSVRSGLCCIDINTGKILGINKEIKLANLLVADGMIYSYQDRNGKVSLLKPNDTNAEVVSSFKITRGTGPHIAHMSIADGLLYVRHGRYLMAYSIKQI